MNKSRFAHQLSFIKEILVSKWKPTLLMVIVDLLIVGVSIAVPYLAKLQLDQLEQKNQALWGIFSGEPLFIFFILLLVAFGVALLQTLLNEAVKLVQSQVNFHFSTEAEVRLYRKLEHFDIGFLQNPRNQRILWTISDGSRMVSDAVSFVSDNIKPVLYIIGVFPLIALIDWRIFIAILLAAVVQFALQIWSMRMRNSNMMQNDSLSTRRWRITNMLNYQLHNILVTAGLEKFIQDLRDVKKDDFEISQQDRYRDGIMRVVDLFIDHLLLIVISLMTAWQVYEGAVSIGSFAMIIGYSTQLTNAITNLLGISTSWISLYLLMIRVGFFMMLESKLDLTNIAPTEVRAPEHITCKSLGFSYHHYGEDEQAYMKFLVEKSGKLLSDSMPHYHKTELKDWERLLQSSQALSEKVLDEVDIVFPIGKMVAIVGRNGSGKSTLVSLVMRHYDPDTGAVMWGNRDLKTVDPLDMRKMVSVIQQTPFIMRDFTLRENLMLGVTDTVSDEQLWKILKKVDLEAEVLKLEGGLDARLGEEAGFSGGQMQLLVIARVLLQNRPVIIFDEGTNQLDAEKEMRILQILEQYKKDRIIILVTHRMTSARRADHIVVIQEGKVAEQGNHVALIANEGGIYHRFWNLQIEGRGLDLED